MNATQPTPETATQSSDKPKQDDKGHVLITGGSGAIGQPLTPELQRRGWKVRHLGRKAGVKEYPLGEVETFRWDIEKGELDPAALEGVTAIIHLAGANVGDGRWTEKRKKELIDSRVDGTRLLAKAIEHAQKASTIHPIELTTIVCAAGSGYYGDSRERAAEFKASYGHQIDDVEFNEEMGPGPASNFLAKLSADWEREHHRFIELGLRTVIARCGVVFDVGSGALPAMAAPAKWGLGAPLGSGEQILPWLHMDDAVAFYAEAVENADWHGTVNLSTNHPVTNERLTRYINHALGRPTFPLHVPAFVLKAMLGEMADTVLGSCNMSARKLEEEWGFAFKFPHAEKAVQDLLG